MSDGVILGVHSNVRMGQTDPETGEPYGFDAGHAWISVTRDGKTTNHGLWPDAHPSVDDNGSGSDIRTGMEDGDTPAASRYYRLNGEQAGKLESLLKANETWGYTNNCSSWARDTVDAVTRVRLNADDPGVLWTETPRQLGDSIHRLEEKSRTSPENPDALPPEKASSTLGARVDLSDTSKQLLQDSELHVRRLAEQHGLPWDQGLDNTVAAVAHQAREDGLSGITHLKVGDGGIRFAQADRYGLKEGAVDARTAANTPALDSKAALAMVDARIAPALVAETREAAQVDMPLMQRA